MTEKLPYWQHPDYDPYEDPSSGILQYEFLMPITTNLLYSLISECICSVEPGKHDSDMVTYSFGDNSTEIFPSMCSKKNLTNDGDLVMRVLEITDVSYQVWIRKIREDLYLLSYELHPTEPDRDSGDDAAWEGGNVDFSNYEFTEEMRLQEERVIQDEIHRIQTENAKYDPYPITPPLVDAILIKSDAAALSESVFQFLTLAFPNLTEILKFCNTKHELPSQFKYGNWMELTIDSNSDRQFYKSLEACFKRQAKEETS